MSSSKAPYIFDEFFTSGMEESISPFLEKGSKKWAHNLSLKSSLAASFFLFSAYITSFFMIEFSHFFLLLVYFLAGTPALLRTFEDIKNFEINIDVLMTMAAFLSFMIGSQMEGGLLLVLFAFSGAMEESVSKKAKGALINLHHLSPALGIVIEKDGTLFQKSVREIHVGTHLLVRAGEVVPLDGKVVDGSSYVNLVHLTGESVPVSKTAGDEVQAGSRNLDGTLTVEVTKTSGESTLSKIIKLIHEAQEMKPKLQRFLDKFSRRYAILVISLFFFFALALPWVFSIPYFGIEGSIYRALTFLIAASPCALIIATPTAYLSAINACARKGILLKGGITLDAFADCTAIAFDKTGTLTTGKLTCIGAKAIGTPDYSIKEALGIASALERHVTHPMAEAICQFADRKKITPLAITEFKSVPGFGLQGKAKIHGKTVEVKIGNEPFISFDKSLDKKGSMISFLRIDTSLFDFRFEDTLRPNVKEVLTTLKEEGVEVVMLTGDHEKSANAVAKELFIDKVYANLRPENKLDIISKLSSEKHLAMVGDGINDAPALTRASVGISMGKIGSATAIDASDIVLLQDDLTLIFWLHKKAKQTMLIVRENLTLALSVIVLAITPALFGIIPLWLAVVLHEGGTVLVGLNSLRLLRK
jgi:heavy metal translocating P-type ATPase